MTWLTSSAEIATTPLADRLGVIVVADASILVVALGDDSQVGQRARDWLVELSGGSRLSIVRNLTPLEVMSAFRRLVQLEKLDPRVASTVSSRFASLPVDRLDLTQPMIARIWELRGNLSTYDAAYVALLEALTAEQLAEGVLATTDRKLAGAPNLSVDVRLFPG
jgi:predicted nucleic acid-binding protein